jgi:hypothetical protein
MKHSWTPTFAGKLQLASDVKQQLGLQLDAGWQVATCERAGKAPELQITHPALEGRSFRSRSSLISFLQALQQQKQALPGVLEAIPDDVMAYDTYTRSPFAAAEAAVADYTAAVAAAASEGAAAVAAAVAGAAAVSPAAALRLSLRQQQRAERQIEQATKQQPQQQPLQVQQAQAQPDQQNKRKRSQMLVAAAVGRARGAPIPAVAAAAAGQLELGDQQQAKRPCSDPAAATSQPSGVATAASGSSIQQQQLVLPDGRKPCNKTLEMLRKQIALALPGAQLDSDWVAFPASHTHPRQDVCILHPSFPNGYFRSARAVGVYLAALSGYVRKLASNLAVPGLVLTPQQQQPTPTQAAAVATAVDKALLLVGRSHSQLSAASVASFEQQRAKFAGKLAGKPGQQRRLPPLPPPAQQRKPAAAGKPSSSAGSSSGPPAAAAATAAAVAGVGAVAWPAGMNLQLADGRKPCSRALAGVQQQVEKRQPGWQLDDQWLVYAARETAPKLDTWVKHPSLPAGYFRSVRGMLIYLDALIPAVQKLGKDLPVPGLVRQQQPAAAAAAKPGRPVAAALLEAVRAAGGGFVWRGPGSSIRQAEVTKHRVPKDEEEDTAPAATAAANNGSSGGSRGAAGYGAGYGLGSGYGDMDCLPAGQQLDVTMWRHPPIDREYEAPPKGCAVLVLGMVFASAAAAAAAHAGMAHHRDRARLMQLRAGLGYRPHSFDRDNPETCGHQGLHVQGNFNSTRGARDVTLKFPGVKFKAIFCDYFRMPTGYACDVYKPQLFTQFVPELIRRGAAELGVPIYMPNNPVLLKQLAAAGGW